MARSSRQEDFLQFREQFPFFCFEKQEFDLSERGLDIRFTFNLSDQYQFFPSIFIPRKRFFLPDHVLLDSIPCIVFHIGMIELISYWKAACSPKVIIRPFQLVDEQISWWKKQYFNGLGEFFYLNGLTVTPNDFMTIITDGRPVAQTERIAGIPWVNETIIPIGGGKDSAVTLELLGFMPGSLPLIMNPRGASLETISVKGYDEDGFIEIRRKIDPVLLQLNDLGFLNGHTPFSAMLAFETLLAALITGKRNIALSNESSASEPTIEGTTINHQYSKSFQFESDFREYVRKWISTEINYFSFLRPLNELQIASLFAKYSSFHSVFKSCNAGSKTDSWCGVCAKCLFTCCILAPFLSENELENIFGKNLFADPSLRPTLDQLTGIADEKPFDCVGTIREVNLALCESIRRSAGKKMPYLLDYYQNSPAFEQYNHVDFGLALTVFSDDHHVGSEYLSLLKSSFLC